MVLQKQTTLMRGEIIGFDNPIVSIDVENTLVILTTNIQSIVIRFKDEDFDYFLKKVKKATASYGGYKAWKKHHINKSLNTSNGGGGGSHGN